MKTKVHATEEEKQLMIYKNFEDLIVKVTTNDGKEKIVESGQKISISSNSEATIEIKQNTNEATLACSGWLDIKDKIQTTTWKTLFDS